LRKKSPLLFTSQQAKLQLLRGCLVMGGSLFGYGALQRIPVAEFTAIYCLVPFAVTLLARFVLKEKVSAIGWLLIAGGMTGALLVVRPGGDVDPTGATLAMMGVVCYTGFQTLTGYLARKDSPLTIQFFTSLLGFTVMSGAEPFFWPGSMTGAELGLLAFVAVAGSYGQFFMVLAFAKAPASVLSPRHVDDRRFWLGISLVQSALIFSFITILNMAGFSHFGSGRSRSFKTALNAPCRAVCCRKSNLKSNTAWPAHRCGHPSHVAGTAGGLPPL
jgi:hypothetical protein